MYYHVVDAHCDEVNSDGVVNTLLERDLVKVKGRSDSPGRPLLYATTDDFLKYFGLKSAADLPRLKELETMTSNKESIMEAENPE